MNPNAKTTRSHHHQPRTCVSLLLALILTAVHTSRSDAAPRLHFTQEVTASGMTPSSTTIVFSVARERVPWMTKIVPRVAAVADSQGTGIVTFNPGTEPSIPSVWAAVDTSTGAYVIDAPADYQPTQLAIDPASMTTSSALLTHPYPDLELLVVRPGVAAWYGRVFDGTESDIGPPDDGRVEFRLAGLAHVWASGPATAALNTLEDGDIVIGIDPTSFHYFTFEHQTNTRN